MPVTTNRTRACWQAATGRNAVHAESGRQFNEIVAENERMAQQLERVGQSVGREGKTRQPVKFGLSSGWQLPWLTSAEQTTYLNSNKAMGVGILRFDINWVSIQAGGPTSYNWGPQDAVVKGAAARGIQILGTIAYTPSALQASTMSTPTGRSVSCSGVRCPKIDTIGPNGITLKARNAGTAESTGARK